METTLIWLLQVLDYVDQSLDQTTTAKIMPKLSLIRSHILLLVFLVQPKQGIILLGVLLAKYLVFVNHSVFSAASTFGLPSYLII